jgi:ADP-glucose pyrophosphorylase
MIEDSVIFPGAKVKCSGVIRHAILAGEMDVDGNLDSVIRWNDETE